MIKHLQTTKRLATLLITLLLGLGTTYAYDFSAVCPTGQTLYYTITTNHCVSVVIPSSNYGWNIKPTGALSIPGFVLYNGYILTVTSIGEGLSIMAIAV